MAATTQDTELRLGYDGFNPSTQRHTICFCIGEEEFLQGTQVTSEQLDAIHEALVEGDDKGLAQIVTLVHEQFSRPSA